MIRVFHVHFPGRTLLLALSEVLIVILAIWPAAFYVFGADAGYMLIYQDQLLRLLLVVAVCMSCMHYYDLYDSTILFNRGQAITRVIQVLGSACVILAFLYYFYPVVRLSQDLLMIWLAVAGISLIAWRRLFLAFNRSARLAQKTLLLGAGQLAVQLANVIESRPELGMRVTGYAEQGPLPDSEPHNMAHLGSLDDVTNVLERHHIERVIVAMENRRGRMPVEQLLAAKARGVIVEDGPAFFEAVAGRIDLASLHPTMLLFSEGFRVSALMMIYKRAASIIGSVLGLATTLPVMAVVAIAIRLDSPGPAIFRQRRLGKGGKPFTLFKFRSMRQGADCEGTSRPAQENDSRCTRIGKFLRRSRLDELPQLFNILRGDMHFVGPRPFAVDMEEELAGKIQFYSKRWTVKPGATGWAQVRKGYNETLEDNVEKLTYDLYYIKNLSLGLDFLIVLETIKILLLGKGWQVRAAATFAFWSCALLVVHTYFLYPVILFVVYSLSQLKRDWTYLTGRKDRRPQTVPMDDLPAVSVIVPAYNEEEHLRRALDALQALDYPAHLVEILIASDCSTDRTNEILRGVSDPRFRILIFDQRRGKASVLNDAASQASHDVFVFCDASTLLSPDAVKQLVRHFRNPRTGVVCGALNFVRSAESRETEGHYWSYEAMLRLMESRLGATLTASGAIYAIRRVCYRPLESDALVDDLLIPMRARQKGYGVVYDPEATAVEFAASVVSGEARRRVRLAAGSFRALPELLRTPMPGFTFFAFLSHKLLRWMVPFSLIGLLASNLYLADEGVYGVLLIAQLGFYTWAGLGLLFKTQLQRVPYALVGYFMLAMNFAILKGFVQAMRNHGGGTWERVS